VGAGLARKFPGFSCGFPPTDPPPPHPGTSVPAARSGAAPHYADEVSERPSLLDPSTLAPIELDLRRVFWVITGLWALALGVTAVIGLVGHIEGRTVTICATGFALGFAALGWERWRFRKQPAEPPSA
jgi:hypothetical protein